MRVKSNVFGALSSAFRRREWGAGVQPTTLNSTTHCPLPSHTQPSRSRTHQAKRALHVSEGGRRDAKRQVLLGAVGCVAVVTGLLLLAAPASAAPSRELVGHISTPGAAFAVALDAQDDVWVSESSGISEYKPYPSTEKILELPGLGLGGSIAVDSANGFLYVAEGETVNAYDPLAEHPLTPVYHWTAPGNHELNFTGLYIAVDNSGGPSNGRLYVLNTCLFCGPALYAFEPDGSPAEFTATGGTEIGGFVIGGGLAVDGQSDIYVGDPAGEIVDEYNAAGEFIQEFTHPESQSAVEFQPSAVAVDPSNGNVLAFSGGYGAGGANHETDEFSPDAEFLGTQGFGFGAFSSLGYLYVPSGEEVKIFSRRAFQLTYRPVTDLTPTSATLNAVVAPHDSSSVTECAFEYGLKRGEYKVGSESCLNSAGEKVGTPSKPITATTEIHAEISHLNAETLYHYRAFLGNPAEPLNAEHFADRTYIPHHVIGLETEKTTEVTGNSAILHASFIGNEENIHYYFEWGTTRKYGNNTAVPPGEEFSSGSALEHLSSQLSDLEPNTVYHYRIVAENSQGTSYGEDRYFETTHSAPVIKVFVTEVQADSAVLRARINPGGADTTYHFEYGTGVCSIEPDPCSTPTAKEEIPIGHGRTFRSVSAPLSNLQPSTVYHYRVIASNEESPQGGTASPEQTFTTFPFVSQLSDRCPNAQPRQQTGASLLLDCRAYELVSAPDTGGFDVESDLVEGQTPFPSYPEAKTSSGEPRLLYSVHDGGIAGTGHPTNRGLDPYVATRGPDGWTTEYVGIPADGTSSTVPFASTLLEADAGLDTFAFGGSEICRPCFSDGSTGIPIHNPRGELVQGMTGTISQPTAKPEGFIGKDLSANGEHLVFGSKSRFEPEANEGELSIYDRNLKSEETHVVSKTPSGQTMTGSGISELDISADGSHILLGQLASESEGAKYWHLFMNIGDSSTTIELAPGASDGVVFDGMTSDGSKVFFSSLQHLTGEDPEHSGAALYMWSRSGDEQGHPLTLISKGDNEGNSGEPGNTPFCDPASNTVHPHWNTTDPEDENCGVLAVGGQGGVASADGTVYFLSPELLDGPAHGFQGAPNLYLARPGSAPQFVATLESSANSALPPSEHPFRRSFGSSSVAGFMAGIAIAEAPGEEGDTYVMGNFEIGGEIAKLNPAGHLISTFGIEGHVDGIECEGHTFYGFEDYPANLAVDNDPTSPSYRDVYASAGENNFVDKFSPQGKCLASIPVSPLPGGVAVDPTNGDLYVGAGVFGGDSVKIFSPTADRNSTPLEEFETTGGPPPALPSILRATFTSPPDFLGLEAQVKRFLPIPLPVPRSVSFRPLPTAFPSTPPANRLKTPTTIMSTLRKVVISPSSDPPLASSWAPRSANRSGPAS